MMIIGLMVIALICLAVGLVLPSSAWLVASLIATAGAGYLLWKMRTAIAPVAAGARPIPADDAQEPVVDESTAPTEIIAAVPADDPVPEQPMAPAVGAASDVWVIDGRPRYHLGNCPIIQGQDAEPIPFEQATEDGFMPCSLCEPNMARTSQ
jgi:hypothetical protein